MTLPIIRDYLQTLTTLREKFGRKPEHLLNSLEHAVLAYGVEFTGLTTRVPAGRIKMCFNNAYTLFFNGVRGLHYCEGYACGVADFPVHHAWCCDDEGIIYEPTWRAAEPTWNDRYLGLVFEDEYVIEEAARKGMPGVLLDHVGCVELDVLYDRLRREPTAWRTKA